MLVLPSDGACSCMGIASQNFWRDYFSRFGWCPRKPRNLITVGNLYPYGILLDLLVSLKLDQYNSYSFYNETTHEVNSSLASHKPPRQTHARSQNIFGKGPNCSAMDTSVRVIPVQADLKIWIIWSAWTDLFWSTQTEISNDFKVICTANMELAIM